MQRSLAFIAVGAIVAVGALCAATASAYGAQPRDGAVATTHSAALVVPSGYKPSTFAPSPVRSTSAGLVTVAPHRAVAVTNVTGASTSGNAPTPEAITTPDPQTSPAADSKTDSTNPTPAAKPSNPISTPAAQPEPPAKPAKPISTPAAKPTPPAKGTNNGNDVGNKGTGGNKGNGSDKGGGKNND